MARIIIAGDAVVVESAHTLEEMKKLEKHRPKALALFDENGKDELFRVVTTRGTGSIGQYGASFGSESKNGEKKAIITMALPAGVTDAKAYIEETIGVAIINLNRVESQFEDALAAVEAEKAAVRENITVL